MKTNPRPKTVFTSILGLLLGLINCEASEFRGIWVDAFGPGFFNAQQVKKLVEDCRKYNFNAVLVEMRRRGDAFYDSRADPRTTIITTNFDALAEIIKECHNRTPRIEVHCWVVSHFIWAWDKPPTQPNHVFNQHPEYLTKDSLGQKFIAKGYYLDPGNPDANRTIYNMAKDIVGRYDIDGFHWDYCRYPTQDSGYNEVAIKRYNEEFGLSGQPSPKDPRFSEWRRRQVTDFLRWVNADLWEKKPNLIISAAVFANLLDAQNARFSDWADWMKEGIVDVCMPMNFSPNTENVFIPRADVAWKNQGIRRIFLGQGAYMNNAEQTIAQLQYAKSKGFEGTALYSYRNPIETNYNAKVALQLVRDRLQPEWVETPSMPWKKSKGIIKGTITQGKAGRPVYNAIVSLDHQTNEVQRTSSEGQYAFFNLEPGRHLLSATLAGENNSDTNVMISAGAVVNADITFGD